MVKLINKLRNKKGFTLIELIVVLAVLGIIMSIAVPRFVGVQEQAKKDADEATLALIARTAELFYVQGLIDEDYVEKTEEIGDDDNLIKLFEREFPNFELQSVSIEDIGKVELSINSTTGRATAKYGDLSSDNF